MSNMLCFKHLFHGSKSPFPNFQRYIDLTQIIGAKGLLHGPSQVVNKFTCFDDEINIFQICHLNLIIFTKKIGCQKDIEALIFPVENLLFDVDKRHQHNIAEFNRLFCFELEKVFTHMVFNQTFTPWVSRHL